MTEYKQSFFDTESETNSIDAKPIEQVIDQEKNIKGFSPDDNLIIIWQERMDFEGTNLRFKK